jgi:hypothetical protein
MLTIIGVALIICSISSGNCGLAIFGLLLIWWDNS